MDWSLDGLRDAGFTGFIPFASLPDGEIPQEEGTYLVVRDSDAAPTFRATSPAGWFKGRDPTVPLERLHAKWVPDATVIYIGKATRRDPRRGLRRRLDEYRRHGCGEPVGHRGGRLVWQLEDSDRLLVAWRTCDDATRDESDLLAEFAKRFGRLPFANLRR